MLWVRDQSGRNLGVLEINDFCGYLNPQSPLECNFLGKDSFPDQTSCPQPPCPNNTEGGDYSASDLHGLLPF